MTNFSFLKPSQKKYLCLLICIFPSFVFSQVGINTSTPISTLDINGNLRIQETLFNSSTEDSPIVVDSNGIVHKNMIDEYTFRGYLNSDYDSSNGSGIYKISDFAVIENRNKYFDLTTNVFTAPLSGLYNIKITITARGNVDAATIGTNVVYGIAKVSEDPSTTNDTWVMRFSVPVTYLEGVKTTSKAGVTNSFMGVVQLDEGKQYYFGTTGYLRLLATPTGSSGQGIGSYFEIQLLKSGNDNK